MKKILLLLLSFLFAKFGISQQNIIDIKQDSLINSWKLTRILIIEKKQIVPMEYANLFYCINNKGLMYIISNNDTTKLNWKIKNDSLFYYSIKEKHQCRILSVNANELVLRERKEKEKVTMIFQFKNNNSMSAQITNNLSKYLQNDDKTLFPQTNELDNSIVLQRKHKIDSLNTLIAKAPTNTDFYYQRASEKAKLKEFKSAIDDYNKIIEIDSKDAIAYQLRGYAKLNLNDKSGACSDFKQAVNLGDKYSEQLITEVSQL